MDLPSAAPPSGNDRSIVANHHGKLQGRMNQRPYESQHMKRDMDLVRKILMVCADHPHGFAPRELKIEGYSEEQIGDHVYLMTQAGLVKGADVTTRGSDSPEAVVSSITWEGHEFLEASRDEGLWSKAK